MNSYNKIAKMVDNDVYYSVYDTLENIAGRKKQLKNISDYVYYTTNTMAVEVASIVWNQIREQIRNEFK